nr:MAG: hypothetical protein [Wenzhou bat rhabdovirus 5]
MSYWDELHSAATGSTNPEDDNQDSCTSAWATTGISLGIAGAGVAYGLYERFRSRDDSQRLREEETERERQRREREEQEAREKEEKERIREEERKREEERAHQERLEQERREMERREREERERQATYDEPLIRQGGSSSWSLSSSRSRRDLV